MWILFAIGSSFFAGITAILAKCGIKETDSNVATAIRTIVVFIFAWIMVLITGSFSGISSISPTTFLFLILSGIATGASWICYFYALQHGDINKVVPIDKSSTILTIILAFLILQEGVSLKKWIAVVVIAVGTYLMIQKKKIENTNQITDKKWLLAAIFSAVFASLTAILAKIGIAGVESNLGTAIRTSVVLIMAWLMVFITGKQKEVTKIQKRELCFICLSGDRKSVV